MVYRPILERVSTEVCFDTTVMVAGLVVETNKNKVAPLLWRSSRGNDASVQSVPLWVQLFDLTRNYGLGVLLVLAMLISMRPVTETLEESSC